MLNRHNLTNVGDFFPTAASHGSVVTEFSHEQDEHHLGLQFFSPSLETGSGPPQRVMQQQSAILSSLLSLKRPMDGTHAVLSSATVVSHREETSFKPPMVEKPGSHRLRSAACLVDAFARPHRRRHSLSEWKEFRRLLAPGSHVHCRSHSSASLLSTVSGSLGCTVLPRP